MQVQAVNVLRSHPLRYFVGCTQAFQLLTTLYMFIQLELLKSLTGDVDGLKTFQKGIKLGQQLVDRDSSARIANHKGSWQVMADFWAETILYIAPSENAAAHIELLTQGGQFVTHI